MRVDWLGYVLRDAGLTVVELAGWRGRGPELVRVDAIVWHATITPRATRDDAVAHLLRDGRPDLPGPLCQLGLDRGGRWWLIADGKGNHNGYGRWGNQTVGIEAFNDGREEWPELQVVSWVKGTRVLLQQLGLTVDRVLGHKETNPTRKTDPKGLDMVAMRTAIVVAPHAAQDEEALLCLL